MSSKTSAGTNPDYPLKTSSSTGITLQPFDEELTSTLLQYRAATNNAFKTPEEDLEAAKQAIKTAILTHIIGENEPFDIPANRHKGSKPGHSLRASSINKLKSEQRSALGLKEK